MRTNKQKKKNRYIYIYINAVFGCHCWVRKQPGLKRPNTQTYKATLELRKKAIISNLITFYCQTLSLIAQQGKTFRITVSFVVSLARKVSLCNPRCRLTNERPAPNCEVRVFINGFCTHLSKKIISTHVLTIINEHADWSER